MLQQNKEWDDVERSQAVTALTQKLSEVSKSHKVISIEDASTAIDVKFKDDKQVYEIHVWLDKKVECTLYNEDVGGLFDVCPCRDYDEVMADPNIVFSDLEQLKRDFQLALEEEEY